MNESMNNESIIDGDGAAASAAEGLEGVQDNEGQAQEPEKKYTDDDVNKIVARKIAAERKRMQKLFNNEQQESEIEVRERNVLKRELMADARDALTDEGLPSSLAKLLNYDSKESFEDSYKSVIEAFRNAVEIGVKMRLRGSTPTASYGNFAKGNDKAFHDAFSPNAR